MSSLPRLYRDLAPWWPILSAPQDYAEEATFYYQTMRATSHIPLNTLLELGSGGGNNASHLKQHLRLTLVDLSPGMLAVSRQLNPQCEHIEGDMRTVRLGRQFDAVFIHDAIAYLTSEADLSQAIATAFEHCTPGGVALFAPDHTRETFQPITNHGGHDGKGRSLRYLEWVWDPDPQDTTYDLLMVYLLRDEKGQVNCVLDRHVCGLFHRSDWLRLIDKAGFEAQVVPFVHSESSGMAIDVFLGIKPAGG